mmetsp:Transcript_40646/g.84605  ORF Transcript_40646/g.84605 Transcript_40646/m.84605 type:complete len:764 (-) Transcript_40646:946-3237(-)
MGAKKKSGGNQDDATTKREQSLQAVLLADSFVNTFRPLSLDRPKVLCPLNNVTMLDYAFDFLAGAGVEEVFVVCVSDEVEAYVRDNSWSMSVSVLKDTSLTNAGDALRELDRRDLVKSDPFVLLFGDVVTNVSLTEAIQAHKARHKKDRSNMMTLLFKEVGASDLTPSSLSHSSIRTNSEDLVVGLNPSQENRILVYSNAGANKSVSVPCSFFASHSQIDLRYDLLDCGIDICSPDVLARFTDEFDYREIRRKFVANSVAEEEEGLQNKIYAHMLQPSEYAARIHDFSTYVNISRDLLKRWCYPVVPDNLPGSYKKQYRYELQRHYMYVEKKFGKSQIHRTSLVKGAGMIGGSCVVGKDCRIEQTVMGHKCRIGDGVTLKACHVWDNVEIGDGASVSQAILADGCIIKSGATVNRGCIIGSGCIVGAGVVLPEFTRITLAKEEEDDFGDDWDDDEEEDSDVDEQAATDGNKEEPESDEAVVGPDGKGRCWRSPPEDEEDEELYGLTTEELIKSQAPGYDPSNIFAKRKAMQVEDGDDFSEKDGDHSEFDALSDFDGVEFGTDDPYGRQKDVDVVGELKAICLEYEMSSPIENLAIELNSFKFSQNASYSDCTTAAILAILDLMKITKDTTDAKLVAEFKTFLEHWAPLLQKMSIGQEEEKAIILGIEKSATGGGDIGDKLSSGNAFRFLLQTLYNEDIVSEEAVVAWSEERKAETTSDPSLPRVKLFLQQPVQEFLEWLLAEESSDEDGDESSGDDDDDSDDE